MAQLKSKVNPFGNIHYPDYNWDGKLNSKPLNEKGEDISDKLAEKRKAKERDETPFIIKVINRLFYGIKED